MVGATDRQTDKPIKHLDRVAACGCYAILCSLAACGLPVRKYPILSVFHLHLL